MVTKESSKRDTKHEEQWSSRFCEEMEKTGSFNRLDPSEYRLGKISTDWKNPIIVLSKNSETSSTKPMATSPRKKSSKYRKTVDRKTVNREGYVDVMEMFKANKDLFLQILENHPDVSISKNTKEGKLTKSGSFPVAEVSRGKNLQPSTIEHKRNETWTSVKGEKLVFQERKVEFAKSRKGSNLKEDSIEVTIKHSSEGSFQVSTYRRWNHFVIDHLRDMKQRIKHAIKESRKKKWKQTNTDEKHLHMEKLEGLETISLRQDSGRNFHENRNLQGVRRASSLNESMDRYSQLFESNFKGGKKLIHSRSLTLKNEEEKISSRETAPKFFRRLSSVSDLESFVSLLKEVATEDSELQVINEVEPTAIIPSEDLNETNSDRCPENANIETESQKIIAEESNSISTLYQDELEQNPGRIEIAECPITEGNYLRLEYITMVFRIFMSWSDSEHHLSYFTLNSCSIRICFLHLFDLIRFSEFVAQIFVLTEIEREPKDINTDEATSLQKMVSIDPLPVIHGGDNNEKDRQIKDLNTDTENSSYDFVRYVLELAGFTENDSLGKWHTLDQPLDPLMAKEMEEFHIVGNYDQQLLFDLINEALLQIYERSFTYFPKTFCFYSHIRPVPKGHRVVEEVWARICQHMSRESVANESLDDIVARDLEKRGGWMTHQFETECLTLEVEDMIFDELLQEILSS